MARAGRFLGWLLLADEPRPEAREALAELRAMGLDRQLLLTGDRVAVATRIGRFLGIADVRAEALPEQKLEAVLAQTRAGYRPLVVGDGINDRWPCAPAPSVSRWARPAPMSRWPQPISC